MPPELDAPDSIVVINVSRIGDTLLVTPALRALSSAWPNARLTFLGHPKRMEVIKNLPFVSEVGGVTKNSARWRGRLPGRRWDLAVVYGFDQALVAYALRVSRRVAAFRQGDPKLDMQLYRCIDAPPFQAMHSALIPLLLTRALGVTDSGARLSYAVSAAEQAWAISTVASLIPGNAGPLIGLQVASFPTKGYRDWPIEHFVALCKRILERWPRAHFAIFGGTLEQARTEVLARHLSNHATQFAGKLTLRETAALMNRLDLYIGVDTGPTHIMGALQRPMIALYHCYSPSRLLAPLEHPCFWAVDHPRADGSCNENTPMAEITVELVWAKVIEALAAPNNVSDSTQAYT